MLKHPRLHDYIKINEEKSVFIFDFSDLSEDWNKFMNGSYSQFNSKVKEKVLNFFEKFSGNYIYIYSYLHPEKWFDRYAKILGVEEELLREVGELCDKPNLEKEKLLFVVADLENIKILD